MSDLEVRLATLSPEERRRLERALLARRRSGAAHGVGQVAPRDRSVPAPLSAAQRRLWFLDRLSPGGTTYNAVVAQWLRGDVDLGVLEEAIAATVARHEVLHSVIRADDDEPVQVVLDHWELTLGRLVAEGDGPDARRRHALALAAEVAGRPYDLANDLPVRAVVVETDAEERLLVLAEHHIAFDGWSDAIAFEEIGEHYARRMAGGPVPDRPAPAIQYADYAAWQRARLDGGHLAGHVAYWREQLRAAPAVTRLPLDRARPEHQRFDGRHLPLDLDHAAGVRRLRAATGVTDFMILVAAWAATLYRWSGESDLVLGTPMANRTLPQVQSLIGFFSNTVPLRVRVDGSVGFADLVGHVRDVVLAAFEHQDLPFEEIVAAAAPERVAGANPLFQVNVRVQSGDLPGLELDGVDVEQVHVDLGTSRFDLAIEFWMHADRIGGYLEVNEAVFDPSTAESLVGRLDQLLGAALADPSTPIWELAQPARADRTRARRRPASPALAARGRVVHARLPQASPPGRVVVHWLDLDLSVDEAALSPAERDRAAAFVSRVHRDHFVRRRAHLRRILTEATGQASDTLHLAVGDHGRPYLPDHPEVRFSASSSGPCAVVAVSEHELGVDIELISSSDGDRDRELARRMFATEEVAALEAASARDFPGLFFGCWTRKEAYVKATGRGLSFPLDSFAVEVADVARPSLLRSDLRPQDLRTHTLVRLDVPGPNAAAGALIVAHPRPAIVVQGPTHDKPTREKEN